MPSSSGPQADQDSQKPGTGDWARQNGSSSSSRWGISRLFAPKAIVLLLCDGSVKLYTEPVTVAAMQREFPDCHVGSVTTMRCQLVPEKVLHPGSTYYLTKKLQWQAREAHGDLTGRPRNATCAEVETRAQPPAATTRHARSKSVAPVHPGTAPLDSASRNSIPRRPSLTVDVPSPRPLYPDFKLLESGSPRSPSVCSPDLRSRYALLSPAPAHGTPTGLHQCHVPAPHWLHGSPSACCREGRSGPLTLAGHQRQQNRGRHQRSASVHQALPSMLEGFFSGDEALGVSGTAGSTIAVKSRGSGMEGPRCAGCRRTRDTVSFEGPRAELRCPCGRDSPSATSPAVRPPVWIAAGVDGGGWSGPLPGLAPVHMSTDLLTHMPARVPAPLGSAGRYLVRQEVRVAVGRASSTKEAVQHRMPVRTVSSCSDNSRMLHWRGGFDHFASGRSIRLPVSVSVEEYAASSPGSCASFSPGAMGSSDSSCCTPNTLCGESPREVDSPRSISSISHCITPFFKEPKPASRFKEPRTGSFKER